jgi:hypothetical protein
MELVPVPSIPQSNALALSTIKSEYTALITTVLEPSKALAVIGQSTYTDAELSLSSIQSAQKRVKAKLDEEIRPRYEELEQWYALKRELLSELDPAETRIKCQMADYNMEQQRLARERQKADDERKRQLSVQAQAEVAKVNDVTLSAIDRARAKFKATQKVEEAKQVVVAPPPPVKSTSSTFIPTETWKVVDMKAFLQGVLDGVIPEEAVMVQVVNMNGFWKIMKEKVKGWPGVSVEVGGRVVGR